MRYTATLTSPPVLYGEDYTFETGYHGDSLVISVDYEYDKNLNTDAYPVKELKLTPKPAVYIEEVLTDICHVGVAGDDIKFKVKLTKPYTTDITVDYTITGESAPVDVNIRKRPNLENFNGSIEDNTNYSDFFKDLDVVELAGLDVGSVTILAGETETEVVIPNTAAINLFKGSGSFYTAKVVLSNLSEPSYMLHFDNTEVYFLLEDELPYPKWEGGEVEVWGKISGLSYYQPIIDPDTSSTVKFTFGYDSEDDGLGNITLTDPTMRSKQIDDTPLEAIQFRCNALEIPVDIENELTPLDLSTNLPYVKYVVNVGRRD